MLILPGALPVAPSPQQAFAAPPAPSPVKTVAEPAASSKTHNETGADTGPHSDGQRSAILPPPPNPDKPVGPPPTFEANLLESEREKLRAGPELQPEDPAEPKTEKAAEPYAPPPQDTHEIDIAV
ncbi:hypothetical protein [Profundibacter sp.]|uniref:hypothetical protein n=1 Tax=Profundibacter sp. TaxID=3101071 RepID=UPI003D0B6925